MGLFSKRNREYDKKTMDMAEKEREDAIRQFEEARELIIYEIEDIMSKLGKKLKCRKLVKRRYRLGKAPNDIEKKKR